MDFLRFMAFIFVFIIIVAIIAAIVNAFKRRALSKSIATIPGFTQSFQHMGATGDNGIAIDNEHAKVCLLTRIEGQINHRVVDHRDIMASEVYEDGETISKTVRSSQLGGVVVGGLLLGGVGAIVGGLSGKQIQKGKIKRIELRLVVNDPARPVHTVTFLESEADRGGAIHQSAAEAARIWQARMEVLIKRADDEAAASIKAAALPHPVPLALSVADELRKLGELKASGLLTDTEFNTEKGKLLSRM